MKSLCTTLIIVSLTTQLLSQFVRLEKGDIVESQCPSDPSQQVYSFENYEIYQTQDNSLDGPRIENCISLDESNGQVDLSSVDAEHALFIRNINEDYQGFRPDIIYFLSNAKVDSDMKLLYGSDCPGGFCSGVSLQFEHQLVSLDTSYFTTIDYPYTEVNQSSIFTECGVTEKAESNKITNFYYKLSFESFSESDQLYFSEPTFSEDYSYSVIVPQELTIPESLWMDSMYRVVMSDLPISNGFYRNHIIKHYEDGIPSSQNVSVTEFRPETESGDPKPIEIILNEFSSIFFQNSTELRGSLLEGSDDLRHPLTIVDEFGNLCLNSIDLIIDDEAELKLGSGVNFDNKTACIQVRDSGTLTLSSESIHHYGNAGVGNLNLRSGANVILEPGAHLYFDGHLILSDYAGYSSESSAVMIDLTPGKAITFTKDATINSKDGSKLYLKMSGGQVSLIDLQEQYRDHIVLVYPDEVSSKGLDITLSPNPANDVVLLKSPSGATVTQFNIYNQLGRLVISQASESLVSVDVTHLEQGLYFTSITSDGIMSYQTLVVER